MVDNDILLNKLMVTFQSEAEDLLSALSSLLITLEKEQDSGERQRLVEALYRKMHTLKGAAQAVNLLDIGESCQSLESLLAALKRGEITLGADLFDNLQSACRLNVLWHPADVATQSAGPRVASKPNLPIVRPQKAAQQLEKC